MTRFDFQPGAFVATAVPARQLIRFAFDARDFEVVGGSDWIQKDRFDILAKTADGASLPQFRLMVQSLLGERFHLVLQTEKRRMDAFVLRRARADGRLGTDMRPASPGCDPDAEAAPRPLPRGGGNGAIAGGDCDDMRSIVRLIAGALNTPVIDDTGLTGRWRYTLVHASTDPSPQSNPDLLPLKEAVRQQLGLKLDKDVAEVAVLVIKAIQPPSEN